MVNFDSYTGTKELNTENFPNSSEELRKKDPSDNSSENNHVKTENKETLNRARELIDEEKRFQDITRELVSLNIKKETLRSEEYSIRKKSLEIEILKAKVNLGLLKAGLLPREIAKIKGLINEEPKPDSITSDPREDKVFQTEKSTFFNTLKILEDKVNSYGYDFDTFIKFQDSEDPAERKLWREFEEFAESYNIDRSLDFLLQNYPNEFLDIVSDTNIKFFQRELFLTCVKRNEINSEKILDVAFEKIMKDGSDPEIIDSLKQRLERERREALEKLSVEEFLSEWEKELPSGGWNLESFGDKIGMRLDELSKQGKYAEIKKLIARIAVLHEKSSYVPKFSQARPAWLITHYDITDDDAERLLTKDISKERFRELFDDKSIYIPFHVIPDFLSEKEKESYYGRIFQKPELTFEDVQEYSRLIKKDIFQVFKENPKVLIYNLRSADARNGIFKEIVAQHEDEDRLDSSPKKHTQNILNSFLVKDNVAELPNFVQETLQNFEGKYGQKGRNLVALAISAYGLENKDSFNAEMRSIESVLDKYDPDNIPQGSKVSMGIEYEVTGQIADTYNETSLLGYKNDIELVSSSGGIGRGYDAVHEIATKPNYNPYMLMAEMKLLQDAGFLDLNFEKYPNAPTGYHLSLVGDSGLSVDKEMYFLNNVMTMAQLAGITAGKEIGNTQGIHEKSFEHFSDADQKGMRCEIKGMAADSIEQFEKAILAAYHAGIAIQICNRYIIGGESWVENQSGKEGNTPQEFEQKLIDDDLLVKPFETDQERDILYEWIKLKNKIVNAVKQHNSSFVDSEFSGYVIDEDGNYIDTSEQIDVRRNNGLVDPETLGSEKFIDKVRIQPETLFSPQGTRFVNALSNINNIFIKPSLENEDKPTNVNAKAILDTMKKEGNRGVMSGSAQESIFDKKQLGELRDGYYYTQGASEEMILHKSQIILNDFNKNMEKYLSVKGIKRAVERVNAATA